MSKIKSVKDPLYNYIELTPVELSVIDRPEFQRLRFVLQNSTAYLTYPSNFNSRFIHSLGVMHLSGLMFTRALQAAEEGVLSAFLKDCSELIARTARQMGLHNLEREWRVSLGNASGFHHRPFKGRSLIPGDRELFTINTLWQAVRLCALIHDIGHLPFSHLFEDALTQFTDIPNAGEEFAGEHAERLKTFRRLLSGDLKGELAAPPRRAWRNQTRGCPAIPRGQGAHACGGDSDDRCRGGGGVR